MRYAETGFNLEIDLSRGNIEKVATDPRDTELYLGGLGTNTKIYYLSSREWVRQAGDNYLKDEFKNKAHS